MIDIRAFRGNKEKFKREIGSRGPRSLSAVEALIKIDAEYKKVLSETEKLRERRNDISRVIKEYKMKGRINEAEKLMEEANRVKNSLKSAEEKLAVLEKEMEKVCFSVPNIPHDSAPKGKGEQDNKIIYEDMSNKKNFDFKPLDHHALGEKLEIIDFARAALLSGSRFALLRGMGAALERAIAQFMLNVHVRENGYTEVLPPYLNNAQTMTGSGQLPKFEEDLYKTACENPLYLIPTAEVPLVNLHSQSVLAEKELPLKYVAHTPCFRREAGSYGKDTRGLIRNHQFNKVELVWITMPEDSMSALEKLREDAEKILKLLKLPYRVVELCTADLGFASGKTYDLEVWMPGEERFREISSISNCFDFQARRINTKVKRSSGGKSEYVHTLNGSGLAVGRTLAAVLENYQNSDNSITVPEVLKEYLGVEKIY